MCGIWGVISKRPLGFTNKQEFEKLVYNLIISSQVRGLDSAGLFVLTKDIKVGTTPGYVKNAVCGSLFVSDKTTREYVDKAWAAGTAIIGHVRAATVGDVTTANAHPFTEGSVTLVHNGTLRHGYQKFGEVGHSDSRSLAIALDQHGKDALKEISGAYAMIWHDSKDNLLHIARNFERPLKYWENDDYVIIASELSILAFALLRADIVPEKGKFKDFESNKHYRWDHLGKCWLDEGVMPSFTVTTQPTFTTAHGVGGTNQAKLFRMGFDLYDETPHGNGFVRYDGITDAGTEVCVYVAIENRLDLNEHSRYTGVVDSVDKVTKVMKIKGSSLAKEYPVTSDSTIQLRSGEIIGIDTFKTWAKQKCECCNSVIDEKDGPNCMKVPNRNALYCPDCVDLYMHGTI